MDLTELIKKLRELFKDKPDPAEDDVLKAVAGLDEAAGGALTKDFIADDEKLGAFLDSVFVEFQKKE